MGLEAAVADYRRSLRAVPDESLGSKLRARRFAEGKSQAELGRWFGVRQQTIGAWERGERPQGRFLTRLAEYLGESEADLRGLLDAEEPAGRNSVSEMPLESPEAVAADALARLTKSYAERIRKGENFSQDDKRILLESVEALSRLIPRS
jgi:transcriptional regulator with XRE-family HTH domain